MLDGDNVDRGIERAGAKRQRREMDKRIDPAVIPRRVAHRETHSAIAFFREVMPVLPPARPRIQHARPRRQAAREIRHGVFDLALEMQDVPPQRAGQAVGEAGVAHRVALPDVAKLEPHGPSLSTQRRRTAAISAEKDKSPTLAAPRPRYFPCTKVFSGLISASLRLCVE